MMRLELRSLALGAALILAPLAVQADSNVDFTGTPLNVSADVDTTTTIHIEGRYGLTGLSGHDQVLRGRPITGSGAGRFVVDIQGVMAAGFDFSANTGGVRVENHAPTDPDTQPIAWVIASDNILFGSGDDVVNNQVGAVMIFDDIVGYAQSGTEPAVNPSVIDFGDGHDRVHNQGLMLVGSARFRHTPTASFVTAFPRGFSATLENLEEFENSGTILMGGWVMDSTRIPLIVDDPVCFTRPSGIESRCSYVFDAAPTDREAASTLSMPGVAYRGTGSARLIIDADFASGRAQHNCHDRFDRGGGQRLVADCVDISGGSTDGVTQVEVVDRLPADLGGHVPDGIVIVDVNGGQSAAGHFVLAPESTGYDVVSGGIDKGLFFYPLLYDAANQQHKLVGLPSRKAYQMPLLVQGAQALARSAGDAWFSRRDQLRATDGVGADGAWARFSHQRGSRDVRQSQTVYGQAITHVNDYDQDSSILSIGRDLRLGDSGWIIGASASYAMSEMQFNVGNSDAEIEGASIGLQVGYEHEQFFLDTQLSGSWFELSYRDAWLTDLANEHDALNTRSQSIGLRTELGRRFQISDSLRLEPMLIASWERSEIKAMQLNPGLNIAGPQNTVFGGNHPSSFRVGAGGRAQYQHALDRLLIHYAGTLRYWHELQGDTRVRIGSSGPDVSVVDRFDDAIIDLGLDLGVSSRDGRVGGILRLDLATGDGYDRYAVTAGLRYQW